jgi:hypothetical protein
MVRSTANVMGSERVQVMLTVTVFIYFKKNEKRKHPKRAFMHMQRIHVHILLS